MLLHLKIVTPERVLHEGEVEQVTLPTPLGEITILPHHIPLVSVLSPGEIIVKSAHEEVFIAIEGGFVEIIPDGLVVLADAGQMAAEIDEARVQEAIERAQKALATTGVQDKNYEMLRALIERETSKIKVARRYKDRGIHTKGTE
ncbi:MAG: ATP synthase F1 subunit epsilon [Candidatus Komeilibacteria bacterium]